MMMLTLPLGDTPFLATVNSSTSGIFTLLSGNLIFAQTPFRIDFSIDCKPIPEPATMLLLSTALAGVAIKTRKKLKSRKSRQGGPLNQFF
jgi:hypothetical protein